jgi:hypothetical protein
VDARTTSAVKGEFVEAGVAPHFDHSGARRDSVLDQFDHVCFRLVVRPGRALYFIEGWANLRSLGCARGLKHAAGYVQNVFRECPLVLLHFEIVFVLGEILCHVDQLAADVIPRAQDVFGRRKQEVGGILGWRFLLRQKRSRHE